MFVNRKSLGWLIAGLLAAMTLAGCDSLDSVTGNDDDGSSSSTAGGDLIFQASLAAHSTGLVNGAVTLPTTDNNGETVTLTEFRMAIEEVKFKKEDDALADLDDDAADFEGPFDVDLLSDTELTAQTIGDLEIPADTYDAIRFKMHKSDELDAGDDLFERSVYIAGTFGSGNTPFVMWHDTGENFDFTGPNGIEIGTGTTGNDVIIDFRLNSIFDSIGLGDCGTPTDINPDSVDNTCKDLADTLKENLKTAADFGKDGDDDGEIDEDEDVD